MARKRFTPKQIIQHLRENRWIIINTLTCCLDKQQVNVFIKNINFYQMKIDLDAKK
jgi:hypothetical protein